MKGHKTTTWNERHGIYRSTEEIKSAHTKISKVQGRYDRNIQDNIGNI